MQITFLGHAGFCVETKEALVIMDPWLSPHGAFDSAWFQFPCNHHLAGFVREKLQNSAQACFVYVSHEHHDHFDPDFLASLPLENVTFILPRFDRAALREQIADLRPKAMVACDHGQIVSIPGGRLSLYLDDSGLSRDSAVLLEADEQSFLNLNDCKLYDELGSIVRNRPISALACQFSGATWHPTCYQYTPVEYERISRQKVLSKFEMVARAIDVVKAKVYLPSAGPACFLDPSLLHLNFEPVNIFPRAFALLEFLRRRLPDSGTRALDISPGDVLDVKSGELIFRAEERFQESDLEPYLYSYAARYRDLFDQLQPKLSTARIEAILYKLRTELNRKLSAFELHERVRLPLYFQLLELESSMLRIDFPAKSIDVVTSVLESDYYSISAPAWQIARILNRKITWEDFALTFRMRITRQPDVYQTLVQGFLLMEPGDMNSFCAKFVKIENRRKRIVVEAGGTLYSIDRYCPHQGGDLSQGWLDQGRLWTCPRHRWQFALDKGGQCLTSDATIHAMCLESGLD